LQSRVVNILKSPATEWPVIAGEATDEGRLYREYIIPLAAIGPVAAFIGWSLLGATLPLGGYYRRPMMNGLTAMVVSYVLALVGVFLCAVIVEWLAPKFKSSGSRVDALKLVAYASTPGWVAGALNVLPALGVFGFFAALYGIYLFYLGLPVLMKTPADQVIVYMIVSAVVVILVGMLMASITTMLVGAGAMAAL
jgi:hypothetical protein